MHLQWQFLFFLCRFGFCSCCAVARLQGHEKRTLTITRQRAARGRQPRFYATFYDCQQWAVAVAVAEAAAAVPHRYIFYVELVSLSFALFSLHFIGQLRCVCVGCVCVAVVISCCTLMIVSLSLSLPLSPSGFICLWGVLKIQNLNWKYLRVLRSTSCHAKCKVFASSNKVTARRTTFLIFVTTQRSK